MRRGIVSSWMTPDIVTITPETTLPDAHRIMSAKKIRCLLIMRGDQLAGIVTRRGLLRADPSSTAMAASWVGHYPLSEETVEKIMTTDVITISKDAQIGKAARVMLENKITSLPVVDADRKLVGILTSSDLFRMVIEEMVGEVIPVKAWMTSDPETITPETTLLEVHRIMGVKRIRSLPVMEGSKLVGIVTRTDLLSADPSKLYSKGDQDRSRQVVDQPARIVMTPNPITISEDEMMQKAAKLMLDRKFHCLPVVNDDGKLVGIVTETDIFHMIVHKGW
jgi:CBS domain-containing protein